MIIKDTFRKALKKMSTRDTVIMAVARMNWITKKEIITIMDTKNFFSDRELFDVVYNIETLPAFNAPGENSQKLKKRVFKTIMNRFSKECGHEPQNVIFAIMQFNENYIKSKLK